MTETKKDENESQNETMPKKKPTAKKYPFQTTQKNNSINIKSKNTEKFIGRQHESKNKTETLKDFPPETPVPVVHETSKVNINLSTTGNEMNEQVSANISTNIDNVSKNKNQNTQLEQTTEILLENKKKLNLVEVVEKKESREKIQRENLTKEEIDEICVGRNGKTYTKIKTPGLDPRFQQQNQTLRCFVMYTDFYRCENILGEGHVACKWFKDVFTSICPLDWVRRWDEARKEGRMPWMKSRTQGKFPGNRYGV